MSAANTIILGVGVFWAFVTAVVGAVAVREDDDGDDDDENMERWSAAGWQRLEKKQLHK